MDVFYGKIEFDGKIYKNIDPRDSYFTLISKKFKGEQSYPQFIDEGFRGSAMDAEKLIIIRENNLFNEIVFLHELPKSTSANFYFGPAKTSDEAANIINK